MLPPPCLAQFEATNILAYFYFWVAVGQIFFIKASLIKKWAQWNVCSDREQATNAKLNNELCH